MIASIDRSSLQPFYYQVYQILRQKIVSDEWKPGDLLPTEKNLQEQFNVSRATVRQALDMLVNEGLIYRHRGRGTFVAEPVIEHGLSRIISFTEDMRQRGLKPGTRLLEVNLAPAAEDIADQLDVSIGEELAHIKRLRLADDRPMSLENSFLIHRCCSGVLEHYDGSQSLRALLEERFGVHLVYARQKIRAVTAQGELAKLLAVETGAPLLFIRRISYDDANRPVELLETYHRGDRYVLYNELRD
jgi:GntR family transcriptional regulator